MGIDNSLPAPEQIEVTLFGPGYGESVLIHLGSNHWMVVDSCIDPVSNKPAALEYLESRGVSPEEAMMLIVASHWHDDHIRGLSEIMRVCGKARVSFSLAFSKPEFMTAVSRYNRNNTIAGGSGVQELWNVYQMLAQGRYPRLGSVGMSMLSVAGDHLAHQQPVQVHALSPSDRQVEKFLQQIAKDLPELKMTKFRASPQSPNQNALVVLVQIGMLGILLGADLEEEGGDPHLGWTGIIHNRDPLHPKATIYKVAHHGSKNAHHDGIWTDLLVDDPYAVLTPWNKAGGLPTVEDVRRMARLTPHGFITSSPKQYATSVKRSPAVDRTIRETVGGKLRRAQPPFGALRLRSTDGTHSAWRVELSQTARPLAEL